MVRSEGLPFTPSRITEKWRLSWVSFGNLSGCRVMTKSASSPGNGTVGRFAFYSIQNHRKVEAFLGFFRELVGMQGNDQIGFFTGRDNLRFRPQGGEVGNQQGSNPQRLFAAVAAKNACFRVHSFTHTGKLHLILLQS